MQLADFLEIECDRANFSLVVFRPLCQSCEVAKVAEDMLDVRGIRQFCFHRVQYLLDTLVCVSGSHSENATSKRRHQRDIRAFAYARAKKPGLIT